MNLNTAEWIKIVPLTLQLFLPRVTKHGENSKTTIRWLCAKMHKFEPSHLRMVRR